jgi:NlpC/P60 family/SH3 domain (SH3b1 type)
MSRARGNRPAASGVGGAMPGPSLRVGGILAGLVSGALLLGCGGPGASPVEPPPSLPAVPTEPAEPAAVCPTAPIDVSVAPGTRPEHRDVEHWLAKLAPGKADEVLVPAVAIPALNTRFAEVDGAWRDPLDPALADPVALAATIDERLAWMRERVDGGQLVEGQPGSFAAALAIAGQAAPVDELHMVVEEASLWCAPLDTGLYKVPVDPDFDRNRCASLHPGEVVRVLRHSPDAAWLYAHAGHTTGWLHAPVLTPALPAAHLLPLVQGPQLVPLDDDLRSDGGHRLRLGTKVPVVGRDGDTRRVLVPTALGLVEDTVRLDARVHEGLLPFTRRNIWRLALAEQDTPYGWGDTGGHRDCSRLVRDTMASFGWELARHSAVQAELGTHRLDVSNMSETDKLAAVRDEAQRGLVLLYMPGHIMMYLGEEDGQHYAVSAISEYLEPCPGGPDTVYRIARVAVTTLELGRGSERTAYVERLATLVVFGPEG